MRFCKAFLSVFVFATAIAVTSASAVCSNASLVGSYGGLQYGDKSPNYGVTLTHFVADGNGNITGTVTDSIDGTISTNSFTGTYSISKNCTGNYTLNFPSQTAHANIVIDDGKNGFQIIRTDSGFTKSGFALAQGKTPCGLNGKKTVFALNFAGTGNGVGPVSAVGQVTLDGKGSSLAVKPSASTVRFMSRP